MRLTVRPAGLTKYAIIASNVGRDSDSAMPAAMIRFLEPFGRDIAVVDVFVMELTATELRQADTQTYDYLTAPTLRGLRDIVDSFLAIAEGWLDQVAL